MKPIHVIIAEITAEEQARRDAALSEREAQRQGLNRKMRQVFDWLSDPTVLGHFNVAPPYSDVLIEVARGGKAVCRLRTFEGKLLLENHTVVNTPDTDMFFDEPDEAFRHIILLLVRHKLDHPDWVLAQERLAREYRPVGPAM